jgi:hypothetical protein
MARPHVLIDIIFKVKAVSPFAKNLLSQYRCIQDEFNEEESVIKIWGEIFWSSKFISQAVRNTALTVIMFQ